MKRLLFILLCFATLAAQAQEFVIGDLKYTVTDADNYEVSVAANNQSISGEVIVPESVTYQDSQYTVTSIGTWAFYDCTSLTSITLPNSVTSISNYAFYGCTSLTSIIVPSSVTSIGFSTFYGCTSLTSIIIPSSVTSIGNYAFYNCRSLTSITIPNSVTSIGIRTFNSCISLTNIEVEENNSKYCSVDGVLFNKEKNEILKFPPAKSESEYIIPSSVTSIGNYAFDNCTSLTSIIIPGSVTLIGDSAFDGCTSLIEIEVAKNNSQYCSVDGVLFNKEKTEIFVFPPAKSESEYIIPSSVTSIGVGAFHGCASLTSIIIPSSVTSIRYSTFYGCTSLTSITIPNSVTSIGDYAFCNCRSLTTITIPNSVTSIFDYAFSRCTSLTTINIPNSVTSIGRAVFFLCDALTSVYYMADKPISGNSNIFSDSTYENATLYVPEEATETCRQIDPWKNFSSIVSSDFSGVAKISADIYTNLPYEVYSLRGVKLGNTTENLTPGVYIMRQGKASRKIVVK